MDIKAENRGDMDLQNRYALIMNCENRVAAAIALAFARNGINVGIHYNVLTDHVSKLIDELRAVESKVTTVDAPLADAAGIELVFERFQQTCEHLDIMVNVLGDPQWQDLNDITFEDWNKSINGNLLSSILATQNAARLMLKRERKDPALILHIMNIQGVLPQMDNFQYAIGTAGVLGLIRKGAYELSPNIRVNGIVIGELDQHEAQGSDKGKNKASVGHNLLKKSGQMEQLGQFAIALVINDFITGAIIPVDGGAHLTLPPRSETSPIDGFEVG